MKKFTIAENGYDPEEVNSFVERFAKEYETLLTKLRERDKDAQELERQLDESKAEIERLNGMVNDNDSSNKHGDSNKINKLENQLKSKQEEIQSLKDKLKSKQDEVAELKDQVDNSEIKINELEKDYKDKFKVENAELLSELNNKDFKIKNLEDQLERYHNLESTLNKAIVVAEDSSDKIKQIAREEARLIVDDAKKNASHIVNDALIKAEKVELEADKLRRGLKVYKSRVKQAISDQLIIVDDVDKIDMDDLD